MTAANQRFGQYLRALRDARRLSLDDVERLTVDEKEPVSRSHLSRLENGQAKFSTLKLLSLSRVYRTRIGTIVERLQTDQELAMNAGGDMDGSTAVELIQRARLAGLKGQLHRALSLYQQAEMRTVTKGGEDQAHRLRARIGVARAMLALARHHIARDALEELSSERLPPMERAWVIFLLCRCYQKLEQPLVAKALLGLLENTPDPLPGEIERQIPALRAELLTWDGEFDRALEAWLSALDLSRATADPLAEVVCLRQLARTERLRGQGSEALEWAQRARQMAETLGYAYHLVLIWTETGRIQRLRNRDDLARSAWNQARKLARALDHPAELLMIYFELWRLARAQGSQAECRSCLRTLRRLARRVDQLPEEARELEHLLAESSVESGSTQAGGEEAR